MPSLPAFCTREDALQSPIRLSDAAMDLIMRAAQPFPHLLRRYRMKSL